jgi:hypothetical protein
MGWGDRELTCMGAWLARNGVVGEAKKIAHHPMSVKEHKSRTVQCEEILCSSYRIWPHANKKRVVINTRKLLVKDCHSCMDGS